MFGRQKKKIILDESQLKKEVFLKCKKYNGKPDRLLSTKERIFLDFLGGNKNDKGLNVKTDNGFLDSHFYDDYRFEKQQSNDYFLKEGIDKNGNDILKPLSETEFYKRKFVVEATTKQEYAASGDHLWKDGHKAEPFEPVFYNDDRMTKKDYSRLFWVFIALLVLCIAYKNFVLNH